MHDIIGNVSVTPDNGPKMPLSVSAEIKNIPDNIHRYEDAMYMRLSL